MPAGIWFWIIYVMCIVAGLFFTWPTQGSSWRPVGWTVVVLILLGLLGWGVFGPPIR